MRQRRAMAEINVVPYIDVMLVLLIIFMVAAPLINPGQIDLPQAGAKLNPAVAPLEVRVRANGDLAVVDRNRSTDELRVDREQLVDIVRQSQSKNADQAVVIAGDRAVRYEEVLAVLDLLQKNQVRRVGLLARPAQ
jgi:biopolymer transport protein TolR